MSVKVDDVEIAFAPWRVARSEGGRETRQYGSRVLRINVIDKEDDAPPPGPCPLWRHLHQVQIPGADMKTGEARVGSAELQREAKVTGLPTVVLLDADTHKLGSLGYVPGGPAAWLPNAQAIVDKARKP